MSDYKALRKQIKTGDLIAFEGKGLFSWIIRKWQHYPVSHVGVVLNIDDMGRIMVMESTSLDGQKGVQMNRLSKRVNGYKGVVKWRPLDNKSRVNMDIDAFQKYLWEQDGKAYDLKQAIKAALWSYTTRENASEMFCSELVAGAWEAGGVLGDINSSEMMPEDICKLHIYDSTFHRLN